MSDLVVLSFDGMYTADNVRENIARLEEEGKVTLEDAVVVSRPPIKDPELGKPFSTEVNLNVNAMYSQFSDVQVDHDTPDARKKLTRRGGAIGFVAGLLIGGPVGAAVVGAGLGNVLARLKDEGIDDDFVKKVGEGLRPDSSAIFLLGTAQDADALMAELKPFNPRLLQTTLGEEQEERLRQNIQQHGP